MKKLALAFSLGVVCTANALAADLPARPYTKAPVVVDPAYNWTGFYVGAHLGYGWEDNRADVTTLPSPAEFNQVPFSFNNKPSGILGGLQAGYNWQTGKFVFGVEADISATDIHGSSRTGPIFVLVPPGVALAGSTHTNTQRMDWFGTVRGRLGFTPANRLLVYATGGLAYGHVEATTFQELVVGAPVLQFTGAESVTRLGWTVGAGGEWAISNNWSIKGEYLYFDLGRHTVTGLRIGPFPPPDPFATQTTFQNRGSIARLGVNYKWGGPVVARY
jgi:outer membrane immunogenic protein